MRFSHLLWVTLFSFTLSLAGCGGVEQTTSIDQDELASYVDENADALAAEQAALDAEEAAEDAEDDE